MLTQSVRFTGTKKKCLGLDLRLLENLLPQTYKILTSRAKVRSSLGQETETASAEQALAAHAREDLPHLLPAAARGLSQSDPAPRARGDRRPEAAERSPKT